jgi:hypothetical protein
VVANSRHIHKELPVPKWNHGYVSAELFVLKNKKLIYTSVEKRLLVSKCIGTWCLEQYRTPCSKMEMRPPAEYSMFQNRNRGSGHIRKELVVPKWKHYGHFSREMTPCSKKKQGDHIGTNLLVPKRKHLGTFVEKSNSTEFLVPQGRHRGLTNRVLLFQNRNIMDTSVEK